jgi:hypothetical protein
MLQKSILDSVQKRSVFMPRASKMSGTDETRAQCSRRENQSTSSSDGGKFAAAVRVKLSGFNPSSAVISVGRL